MTPQSQSLTAVAYALTKYHQHSQTFVDLEINELRRKGIDVRIVSVERGHEDRDGTIYMDAVSSSWATHGSWLVRHPVRYLRFLYRSALLHRELGEAPERVPWARVPSVARMLSEHRIDVVHAHFGWSGATLAALLSALLGTPWSMTLHAKDIFAKQRYLERKLAMAAGVVTVCDYNRRWMHEQGLTDRDMTVITCGVELPAQEAAPFTKSTDVIGVGRLVPKKGFDVLVRAIAELAAAGIDVQAKIVGDGPEGPELKRLADALGITDRLQFTGPMDHDDALREIAAAKVFCLPARVADDGDRDAMPTVIIEAMMRRVPVVSTRVVGIPEMVDATVGRLVEPDDVAGTAAALRELLADPQLAARLGDGGAQRAREGYSLQRQADRLSAHLAGLVRP